MPELSILIPACKEEFLPHTVRDVLSHIEADTEIIVVINGDDTQYDMPNDARLRVITVADKVGQRAGQNLAARNSRAKYVMKLDAHCSVEQGFDRKLIAQMEGDMTIVPVLRNLWVYNWACTFCEATEYQGPRPKECKECGGDEFEKVMIWKAKTNPINFAYLFNRVLQFKYFGPLNQKLKGRVGMQEILSLQGSCFMATRDNYWAKELCDEKWGSWGQQGSEVALKTWLSGGRVMVCMDTWYGHQFRTKSGDAFPHGGTHQSQEQARKICRDLFLNDKWHKQVRPLAWLLDKFWDGLSIIDKQPEPQRKDYQEGKNGDSKFQGQWDDWRDRWRQSDLQELKARPFRDANGKRYEAPTTKGIIYYTDSQLPAAIAQPVIDQLVKISADKHIPIVTAALRRRLSFGTKNMVFPSLKRGAAAMFKQILGALEHSTADVIFFTEHDCLYHPSHFDFTPPDPAKVYYNLNLWQVRASDGHAVYWDAKRVSQLCGYRDVLIEHYRRRLALVEANGYSMAMGYEPGSHNRPERVDDLKSDTWRSAVANIDIKHGGNLSPTKWSLADFRTPPTGWQEADEVEGWPNLSALLGVMEHEKELA